jgi:hypothetical protein
MPPVPLPEGFRWTWAGDTVRVNLPTFVRTESHVFEPLLSRGDAERLAEAIGAHARRRKADGVAKPLGRVLLAHDPRYTAETLAKFRSKLSIALVERGHQATIDEMVTMSGTDLEPEA